MNFLYPRFPYVWLYVTERILSENIRIFTACTAEMILRFYLKDFFLFLHFLKNSNHSLTSSDSIGSS